MGGHDCGVMMEYSTLESLADQVRELRDREEIARLLHEYCRAVDLYHPEEVAAVFTEDCVVSYGPTLGGVQGRDALASSLKAGLAHYDATNHLLGNVQIDFDDPDSAHGMSLVYAWHRMRNGAPDAHLWAQYHDRFVRTTGGWLIAQRRLLVAGESEFPLSWEPIGRRAVSE
ncbi:MAG: nuclear transport factor 2 family protein [Microthrixaceae bacterium]